MFKRKCHVFKIKDQWYLFDVRSSAASMVSHETAEIMLQNGVLEKADVISELSKRYAANKLDEAWDELCKVGFLSVSEPPSRSISHVVKEVPISKVAFNIAHDCNMRCKYCYAGKGSYGGIRALMPKTVAEKALDLIFAQNADQLHIGFFGGEPLLNYDLIKWVVKESEKRAELQHKSISFSINTNGILLAKATVQFLIDHKFGITISLDGPPEINDSMRVDASGKGTYNKVVANIRNLIESKADYLVIRPTFCGNEINLRSAIKHLLNLGAKTIGGGYVLEPNSPYAATEDKLDTIQEQYIELIDEFIERNLCGDQRIPLFVTQKVNMLQARGFIDSGCGAGTSNIAISPDGNLYPCHRLPGYSEVLLGTVEGIDEEKRGKFIEKYYSRLNNCENCWAKNICGGRCIYLSLVGGNPIDKPLEISCKANKKDCETAVYTLCQLKKHGLSSLGSIENI